MWSSYQWQRGDETAHAIASRGFATLHIERRRMRVSA